MFLRYREIFYLFLLANVHRYFVRFLGHGNPCEYLMVHEGFYTFAMLAQRTYSVFFQNIVATFGSGAAAPTWTSTHKLGSYALSFDGGDYLDVTDNDVANNLRFRATSISGAPAPARTRPDFNAETKSPIASSNARFTSATI